MRMVAELGLQELEVEGPDLKIRILGPGGATAAVAAAPALLTAAPALPQVAAAEPEALDESLHVIESPMVGTFYRSPRPGSPVFTDVGQTVAVGDVICILEAMKIMNEIEADKAGVVAKILVEDGEPVEFGQPLFALKP